MSTFAGRTILDVMKDARQRLNDNSVDIYGNDDSDPTMLNLLSFVADAYNQIEMQYAARDINMLEKVVETFSYTAGASTIPIPGGITDLQEPVEIYQRLSTSDPWSEVPRLNRQGPPLSITPQFISAWEWSGNAINVNPASTSLQILVRYRRLLDYAEDDAEVEFENIYWPLVWETAYLASIPTRKTDTIGLLKAEADQRIMQSILVESRELQSDVGSFGRWSGRRVAAHSGASVGGASIGTGSRLSDPTAPSGVIDSTDGIDGNGVFTLARAPSPASSLFLVKNGVLQLAGTNYNLAGSTITYVSGNYPITGVPGDWHLAWYRY